MKKLPGFLIAFEGIDGSGKSTLSKLIFHELNKLSVPIILTKEPGGTPEGQRIRSLVHEYKMTPQAEFLLFSADRSEHIARVIQPGLAAGAIILSDRMADSSRAYQGYGRGIDLQFIDTVTSFVMQGLEPNLIIYCKIDAETAYKRIITRNEALTVFEREKTIFFERVIAGFETIFSRKHNVYTVDATQPPEVMAEQVLAEITRQLENHHAA